MLNANALEGFIFLCVSNEEELMNEIEGVSLGGVTDPVSQVYPFVLVVLLQGIGVKVIEWHTIRKVKGKHERNLKGK